VNEASGSNEPSIGEANHGPKNNPDASDRGHRRSVSGLEVRATRRPRRLRDQPAPDWSQARRGVYLTVGALLPECHTSSSVLQSKASIAMRDDQ
jgi:hypothetical protein